MKRTAALLAAVGGLSCTELSARWNDHDVFFGAVRESGGSTTLTTFCAETSVERSKVIVFSAAAETLIEEEVLVEGRTEKYMGEEAPERDASFWCSDVPQLYVRPVNFWGCLRAADDDPPATILAIESRGEIALSGASSGYALTLQIRHPGVLRVIFDAQCLRDASNSTADAGAPVAYGELTVQ